MKTTIKVMIIISIDCLWALCYSLFFVFLRKLIIVRYDFLHFHFCNGLRKWKSTHFFFSFYQPQITSIWSLNYIHQQSTFKNDAQISVATKNMIYVTDSFFTVPNIPITNKESGIMTRALPTPTEKGVFFFHKSETYELICNYDSCWWVTHPHQRTVVRNNWPVAMYISDAFTNTICENCGNDTYICLISIIKFWLLM